LAVCPPEGTDMRTMLATLIAGRLLLGATIATAVVVAAG
jgi:hypothetical protein